MHVVAHEGRDVGAGKLDPAHTRGHVLGRDDRHLIEVGRRGRWRQFGPVELERIVAGKIEEMFGQHGPHQLECFVAWAVQFDQQSIALGANVRRADVAFQQDVVPRAQNVGMLSEMFGDFVEHADRILRQGGAGELEVLDCDHGRCSLLTSRMGVDV